MESSRGGNPAIFVLGKRGPLGRLPRGLEIALQSMAEGEISSFTLKPSLGFGHPDCTWRLGGAQVEDWVLDVTLELASITKGVSVQIVEEDKVVKETIKDGAGWENSRPPYQVVASVKGGDGFCTAEAEPLRYSCGTGAIPKLLEESVNLMFQGEVARIHCREPLEDSPLIPASASTSEPGRPGQQALQTWEIGLLEVVQVRDMVGTGEVMKSRVARGEGEFPIDCPIVDCPMRIRCVGRLGGGAGKEVFWDTDEEGSGEPLSLETGMNVLPDGLEMCLKLMVPGETSVIQSAPKFAYDDLRDLGDKIATRVPKGSPVEWEVTLVDFNKPKQLAELPAAEALREALARKEKANALFKTSRYRYAQARYELLLREVKGLVDAGAAEAEDLAEPISTLVVGCTLNLAACAQRQGDHAAALKHCNEVLDKMDPDHAKALYRRGQTYTHLSEWAAARRDYERMAGCGEEHREEAEAQLARISRLEKEALKRQKKEFQGFFNR